ncbi:MAG TPA: asparagine synthase (glutamine-hydrolyzing) [Candidatus Peribacteraceae bacterium]|nr:asparagine synthase (glutamine-hydrolyzing) [Candidatus Peribacteraceae bacterium]
MCGIAGFFGEDKRLIERMTQCLVHRGPDGNAVVTTHGASLGHARLAILDPRPEGDQPMWNESRTAVIVYNGEIYNYRQLREEEKFDCKTTTDTEVLLKLFDRYGMEFVKRLKGMFAFGIYDTRKRTWYLARDTSGIKPLFIAYSNGRLHFASEMRALLAAFPVKPAINLQGLSLFMRLQYVPGPQTLVQDIESLPPGVILEWSDKGETLTRFRAEAETPSFASKEDFGRDFPALMDDVVRDHLVSDKPVGIFLSGGMDSSIVLHHMSHHASKPIKTFTVRFDATEKEGAKRFNADADFAAKTAKFYGTDHHELLLTADLYREFYKDTARSLDQPNADTVSVAQFLLSREAKKHVDVVLNGSGGDELFGGYPRYRVARILHELRHLPGSVRSLIGGIIGHPRDVLRLQPGPELAERLLARPIEEIDDVASGTWFDGLATAHLFQKRFSHLQNDDPVRAFMEFDRGLWLVDESLRLADATTMGSGLECRVPFLDPRVIAASHATPSHWHVAMKRTKALLKDTYKPLLPPHLFSLEKSSFYIPFAKWLRREASPLVEEALENPHIGELFDIGRIRALYDEHKNGGYHLHTLSSLIQLSNWFETVYDAADAS